ncbi:hypothetical protein AGLY_000873 [Aphis glycines]|uniref:Uncharacterized protein n=1 Tax=Aphis glycines TaxID=307491 RepID=A0A6G0U993_APHGL|nr:hypothetical protein AGLY_000873 [Aphis glycines]
MIYRGLQFTLYTFVFRTTNLVCNKKAFLLTLLCSIEKLFVHEYLFLEIIGGIGMGMIKTSFFVLLSTLFIVNRHTAHLCLQVGSFTGMMLIPASIHKTDTDYFCGTISDKRSLNFLFTDNEIRHQQHIHLLYDSYNSGILGIQNVKNVFRNDLIGSRPIKIELNTTSIYLLAMTRVCATADIEEEKSTSWLSCKFPIASSRVLTAMFHMPIWINKQFILMVTSEALIHAACFVLFMSIKERCDDWVLKYINSGYENKRQVKKSSGSEDINRSSDYPYRRLLRFIHRSRVESFVAQKVVKGVPLYSVGLALMANGLSLIMFAVTINNFAIMLLYFGLFVFFGNYKSLQNIVLVSVFPVKTFNNVCGVWTNFISSRYHNVVPHRAQKCEI